MTGAFSGSTSRTASSSAPVVVAPAMNGKMWEHPATRANCETLKKRGVTFIEPAEGMLACGYEGKGRLASPEEIVKKVNEMLAGPADLR